MRNPQFLDQHPHGAWRPAKRPTWMTTPRHPRRVTPQQYRKTKKGRVVLTAAYLLFLSARQKFNRFSTTPDWEGIRGAHLGANLCFQERR